MHLKLKIIFAFVKFSCDFLTSTFVFSTVLEQQFSSFAEQTNSNVFLNCNLHLPTMLQLAFSNK